MLKENKIAKLVVEDSVILELKSVESVAPVHKKQLLTYLKLTDKRLGLLLNFGAPLIKKESLGLLTDLKNKIISLTFAP